MRICWSEEKALDFVPKLIASPWSPKEVSLLKRIVALVKRLYDPYSQPIVARVAIDKDSPLVLVGHSKRYKALYQGEKIIAVPRDALHVKLKIRPVDPAEGGPLFLLWIERFVELCLFWRKPFDPSVAIGTLPSTVLGFGSEGHALSFSLNNRKITLIFDQAEKGKTCQGVLNSIVRQAKLQFIPRSIEEFKDVWTKLSFEERGDWFTVKEFEDLFKQEAKVKAVDEQVRQGNMAGPARKIVPRSLPQQRYYL
jgi:hypothetical protein